MKKKALHKAHSLIPRNSLAWLLTAQIVVLLPHLPRLPFWVSVLWLGCALWRVQIQRMRWGYPGPLLKTLGIAAITAGVWFTERTLIGLDAAVMLLLLLFMFKLLEMRNPRDAIVVIYLGFFIIATAFLFAAAGSAADGRAVSVLSAHRSAVVGRHARWQRHHGAGRKHVPR